MVPVEGGRALLLFPFRVANGPVNNRFKLRTSPQCAEPSGGPFLAKVPKLFGRHNSLCIFESSNFTILLFCFDLLFRKLKDHALKTRGWQIYKWLYWPEKLSGRFEKFAPATDLRYSRELVIRDKAGGEQKQAVVIILQSARFQ